ncbi:MAG: DUF4926 domain-containing protein [Leptolyngbyaceae cyanobacterium]
MKLELYQEVSLNRDFQEYDLKAGDVATLVDYIPHPEDGEEGCVLEVFNALGESLTVVTVPRSAIEALRSDEIMTVRSLMKAG